MTAETHLNKSMNSNYFLINRYIFSITVRIIHHKFQVTTHLIRN